jgi:hypothetical protein
MHVQQEYLKLLTVQEAYIKSLFTKPLTPKENLRDKCPLAEIKTGTFLE